MLLFNVIAAIVSLLQYRKLHSDLCMRLDYSALPVLFHLGSYRFERVCFVAQSVDFQ